MIRIKANPPTFRIKDHEERTVPMSYRIVDAFKELRTNEGYLLNSGRGDGKNRYRFEPKKGLLKALEKAGLTTEKPLQRLRITYGSILVLKGGPIHEASRFLGHSSVTVTEQHYIGLRTYNPLINAF